MALTDYFLAPLGLAALASLVPLVVLYLLRPRPPRRPIPTLAFLGVEPGESRRLRALRRLSRDLLLLLQALVLVAMAVALAAPYVPVSEDEAAREVVLVVDASASMATQTDRTARFDRAVARARGQVAPQTTVVVAGAGVRVPVRDGPEAAATEALDALRVTDAPGDLRSAVASAALLAGEGGRVVVFSDFAGDDDWRSAVEVARADGLDVDLRQSGGGATPNVGIVDLSFERTSLTATVANFGDDPATRTLRLGEETRSLTLQPGDRLVERFDVPAGDSALELEPRDALPTDDAAPVAGPPSETVRVLLLTNGENRYLRTALSVLDGVDLTVRELPAPVTEEYDVVVFADVDPERLLRSNLDAARETLERGGGVAILAQPDLRAVGYGDLLPVRPAGVTNTTGVGPPADDPITAGIEFPAPERHVAAESTAGRVLLAAEDGSPVVATARVDGGQVGDGPAGDGSVAGGRADRGQADGGRVLYYGYLEADSSFHFEYQYPVFWKRAVDELAGREELSALNVRTGERLLLGGNDTVETPTGPRPGPTVVTDRTGYYGTESRRVAAALLSEAESNVTSPAVGRGGDGNASAAATAPGEPETVPRVLTPLVAVGALVVVLGELAYLRSRGEL